MKIKNKGGYVLPAAIGVLVVASLALLVSSWFAGPKNKQVERTDSVATTTNNFSRQNAVDDAALDADASVIDDQLKALDKSDSDIGASMNDTSTI